MKVYNLVCSLDHHFEGWFASEADANDQEERGLISCPICECHEIKRLPSAPRISKGLGQSTELQTRQAPGPSAEAIEGNSMVLSSTEQAKLQAQLQATMLKAMREFMSKTEDVGSDFANEARKIHYQEAPERSIRGSATMEETVELREEGIDVIALPNLMHLKNRLQ